MLARAHIIVSGLVQGVYYRTFTQKQANTLGLTGWVKNLFEGRVEILCEGEKGLIMEIIKQLRVGPPSSDVTDVKIELQEYVGEFKEFKVVY